MSSRNFNSIGCHLPSPFLSSFPPLSLFLPLLFLLFPLIFPDFGFLKRVHQHQVRALILGVSRVLVLFVVGNKRQVEGT